MTVTEDLEEYKMLTRIISAAVAIVIAVAVLCFHNTIVLNIAVAALIAVALFELFRAEDCLRFNLSQVICYIFAFTIPFSEFLLKLDENIMYYISGVFLLLMFITFLGYYKTMKYEKLSFMIFVSAFISVTMSTILYLDRTGGNHGLFYVVLTLCGAWLADSGAYFAGTFLGRHKLCPNISPKKTVEGLIGGIITNGLIFVLLGLGYTKFVASGDIEANYITLFILGMICALLGLLGDLSASLLKRQTGIKDYGNIMPGHGGVMDRFDSVLFVAPFMTIALSIFSVLK